MGSVFIVFLLTHPLGQTQTQVPNMTIEFHDGSVVFKDLTPFRPSRTGTGELVPAFGSTIENNSRRAFGPLVQVQIDCVVAVKVGREQKSATIALDFDLTFPAVAPSSGRRFDQVLSMWMDKLPPCEVASARAVPLSYAPYSPEDRARQATQAAKFRAERTKLEALLAEPQRHEEEQAAAAEVKRKAQEAARAKQEAAKRRATEEARRKFLAQHPILYSGTELVFIGADRKCAAQFVEAAAMEGLEKRKRLADLLAYGCGFTVRSMVHVRVAEKQGRYSLVELLKGDAQGKSGWVLSAWLK